MATSTSSTLKVFVVVFTLLMGSSYAQLSLSFYARTCPQLLSTVKSGVTAAVNKEKRMGASLLRLHFHDCFVNGCDGSVLLNDTLTFTGEQTAFGNNNSLRGFNVIGDLKALVEQVCPGVVSCADILALAARDSTVVLGGPSWPVKLGRRDSTTASFADANDGRLPLGNSTLPILISTFQNQGFTTREMVALSGSHTIGQARCITFRGRLNSNLSIDPVFAQERRAICPANFGQGDSNLAPLDLQTPNFFENNYYKNLLVNKGLLTSDQVLFNGGSTDSLVRLYSNSPSLFNLDFARAMVKMGDLGPLTGSAGEIRKMCDRVN